MLRRDGGTDRRKTGVSWWVKAPLPRGWQQDVRALGIKNGLSLEALIEQAIKEYAEKRGVELPESDDTANDADSDELVA